MFGPKRQYYSQVRHFFSRAGWPVFFAATALIVLALANGGSAILAQGETASSSVQGCFAATSSSFNLISTSSLLFSALATSVEPALATSATTSISTSSSATSAEALRCSLSSNIQKIDLLGPPFRFLLIGDSFIDTYSPIGDLLKKTLAAYKNSQVNRVGKVSSGLARPDFFNWNIKAQELLAKYEPNTVVVMLGANDDQALKVTAKNGQKKYLAFGTEAWKAEYGRRVAKLIRMFQEEGAVVFWVGLPVVRDQERSERYNIVNEVVAQQTKVFESAYYIPTWSLLCDKVGKYAGQMPNAKGKLMATHTPDGIHLSFFSGGIIVKKIMENIGALLNLSSSI